MKLLDYMKRYTEEALSQCDPGSDPCPMLAWRDRQGRYGILLIPSDFDNEAFVARLINKIIVVLIVNGAREAIWATAAWQLKVKTREELPDGSFANHPDRIEVLQLMHAEPGGVTGYVGEVIRVEGKPPMFAGWEEPEPEQIGVEGRYPEALQRGMAGAAAIPEELRAFLDSQDPEVAMATVFSLLKDQL